MNQAPAQPSGGNGKAVAIGILAMIIGAAVWAVITVVTEHEFSLVAIGVGALIGLMMYAARPTSTGIAVVAALLTVVGCALGEFLALAAYVSRKEHVDFGRVLNAEFEHFDVFVKSLDGKTYLFWAIGAIAAFSMVFRRIQAARAMAGPAFTPPPQAYGPPPQQAYGPAQQPYAPPPQQPYGPPQQYPPRQPQGSPQPYGAPQRQGQPPYGPGQPPYGQQYPPR